MSNIVIRTRPHAAEGDTEQVDFSILVEEEDWLGLYDRLQVLRSIDGPSGPFELLTDIAWTRPRLPKDGGAEPESPVTGALVTIVGKTLQVDVLGQEANITFTGSDPLTAAQVASQIEEQSGGRLNSYVNVEGQVVVEANFPGLISVVSIPPSDGAVLLGLPTTEPDNTAQGKDPHVPLVPGVTTYTFRDPFGSRSYYYRTRLLNSASNATSDSSVSFSAGDALGVPPANTILGYVELVELTGKASRNVQVFVHNDFAGELVDGKAVGGGTLQALTDESGRAEFILVRGQRLTVSVQGTTLARSITVPSDPELFVFNLFDPAIGEVDVFRAAVPEIITAERRTL